MSRSLPRLPRLSLWTLLFAWLLALPALGASLKADKSEIDVGETVFVKLDADLVLMVDWSSSPELTILNSSNKGATVKGAKAGKGKLTVKYLGGKKSTSITVVAGTPAKQDDLAPALDKSEPASGNDDEAAIKLEGLARSMGMPDLDARIARMLFEVNTGKRTPKQFYDGLAKAGGNMFDVIKVRSRLVDHPDQSFTRQIMGPTFSENGTPVEQKILTWRRQETLAAIDEVVKRFVDAGRVPADGYTLLISHVGKWANQADRSLTFTGDIDFSFVSNDTALAEAMKEVYAEVIKRRTGLDPKSLDSVCTAHGKAGLEVYIGRHGMAFAEEQMKINELVDMSTGARTPQDLNQVAHQLTSERDLAASQGKELPTPALNTEPGLSMEMARHFQHDIVGPKLFDLGNAVVKAAKYLDRSYKALDKAGGQPADSGLADFARRVTELANAKPQTKAVRDEMLRLVSEQLGSPPRTVWDMGTNKLVLTIDAAAVERFHQSAGKALWDTVRQGSNARTNELDGRLRDLLDRQAKGDKVDEDVAKLRQEMVDLVDMVEAEIKAAHGADIPIEVRTNNAKVRAMLDTLSKRFGVKKLSAEELKDKKFVEELLKAEMAHPDPSRLKMVAGYVMERTARAAELSMSGVEKTNQLLDIIDDRLLGPLRGDSDFAEFEAEMKQVRQASMDPRLRSDATSRLSVLKTKVSSTIKGTNLYLNEKLQATAAGRQGMKFMMVYGLVDEMQAYRDAFNEKGWGGFATEIFKRRIPFGGAVESAVMGNTLRAGWDVVTTLIPPLALPEAAYGLGTMIGTQVKSTYWSEQLALFTDGLYADAIFKLEEVQTYENAKVGQYRLVRTFHNQMPLDLHRFAEMRKDQVEALSKEVEAGHVNWQAYKNNFNGLTEWLDVDATLKANLAASDPALQLLEEMANHEAVGPKLMERLAEKGLARWEQVKLGYVVKLIKHLEDRKQADDALGRGMLPDLFAELRKVAADLAIEDEVMKGLDAEVDTSNLKTLVKWLWDTKRSALGQAPTESETTRAAQVVKKYLDAYKQVQALRDQAAGGLAKAAVDVNTRYLTSNLFLSGRADPDLAAARAWIGQIETARKAMAGAILAIKRTFLPKAGLDSADQPYLDRAFAHEVWVKPYQDGNARLKKAWMNDYASGHVKERDKVLAEYKDWLTKLGPVQLTVTAIDAKDAKKTVSGLKIALAPTDELGKPVSASAAGNQVVMGVPMGRYNLTASAPGYLDASRSVVYGRGLKATPSEKITLTPSGKDPDKDKDQDKDGKPDGTTGTQPDVATTGGDTGKPSDPSQTSSSTAGGLVPTDLGKVSCGNPTGVFDKEPFNRLQVRYGISGVCAGPNKDSEGFTHSRYFDILGITGDTITVSGSGAPYGAACYSWAGSFWFQTDITLTVGDQKKTWSSPLPCERKSDTQYNVAQPAYSFNLSLPVPKDKEVVGVSVTVEQTFVNPRFGNRGVVVSGSGSHIRKVVGSFPEGGQDGVPPPPALLLTLEGPKDTVKFGQPISLAAKAEGGKPPYGYSWSGADGHGASASLTPKKPGEQEIEVTASDSAGQTAKASLKLKVDTPKLTLNGLPTQPVYGSQARLSVSGLPDFTPAADPCAGRDYTGRSPFGECLRISNVPMVSSSGTSSAPPPPIPAGAGTPSGGSMPSAGPLRYRFVWQSSPDLTFDPATSEDGATTVTFDRMGQIKVWCEVLVEDKGAWVTLAETDQQTINVVAPAFSLQFTPPDGQGKIGKEVRTRIVAKPEVPAKLIDYRWFEPASGNRMEYADNASEIGFKVKDAKAMKFDALARVPHHGDEIAKITGAYTGVAYDVKIGPPKARGPQLQVWVCDTQLGNAKNCGMKDIPQGQFATFQDIFLAAQVTPAPESPRYRWTVDPSGSCGLPGSGSELRLNCSNTGSYTVRLQITDADNIPLGQAETGVNVSVSDNDARQAPKSKEAYDKMQQAKQRADEGQLDEAINLAGAAAGLDPKNAEAKDLGKRWNDERKTVRQQIDRAKKALQGNKPDDAQKEVDAAKKLHPKYPPVLDTEKQLADKRKSLGQTATGKPLVETAAMPPTVGAAQPISLAGVGGQKGAPRVVKGVAVDDSSWIRFKSTDENRRSLDIPVPTPTRAVAIAVVSNLDDATYLEQGKTIARIIVSKDTGDEVLDLQAGVHTSEWNYGVGPKHKRVDSADIGDNRFLVVLPLARPGVVKAIRVEYVETNAPKWSGHAPGFCLRGISLVTDTRGLALTPAGTGTVAMASGNVAGKWRSSEGELTLNQSGRSVSGGYNSDGGEIVGEMNGNVLEGYWIENGSSERCATAKNGRYHWGRIRWTFDGGKFVGNWSYCDKPVAGGGGWNGERTGDVPPGYVPPASSSATVPSPGGAAAASPQAGGGLIAAYALDGDARDASGNNRHGSIQGARATADRFGRAGGAMLFDGKAYIELPLDINPGAYPRLTFTAWVRADDASPTRQVMSHDNGGYDRSLGIDPRGGGTGWSAFAGTGGVLGFKPVEKGRWAFVAGVWDQTARKVRLMVDDTVMEKDGEIGGSDRKLSLGRNPGYGEYFVGAIDDVRLYDRALDPGEIRAIRGGANSGGVPPTADAGGLAGTWAINANGYTGKLELSESGGRLSGRVWFDAHRVWEDLRDFSFDGRTLRFLRPGPNQRYTGTYSGDQVRGSFDGGGTWNWSMTRTGAAPGITAGTQAGAAITSATGGSLRLDRTAYAPGESIVVHFTAPGTWARDAWIGIVPSGIPHGDERQNDNHDITYQYLNKRTSGTLTFTAPAAGNWDFRLHDTDNNGKEQASVSFRVDAATVPGGRDYTGHDSPIATPDSRPGSGYLRIEACVDGSDWISLDNGRLNHQHRAFDQIGTHGGCPVSHRVTGGGFLVDGLAVGLARLPMPVGMAGIGRFEVERGRGQVRMDGTNRILIDDDGAGGSDVYIIRLYPSATTTVTPPVAIVPGGRDYTAAPVQGQLIFEVGNIGGVGNGPSKASKFTLAAPHVVTLIRNYHWNSARGAAPGSIALKSKDGGGHGPWRATGSPGQGGVPNAYWTVYPNVTLPAGTYTVIDSDPATWSYNAESNNRGFVRVEGYPADSSQSSALPTTGNAQVDSAMKEVDGLLDAVKSLKGLFGK